MENSGDFSALTRIATMIRSNSREPAAREVLLDERGGARIALDEGRGRGAAAQRLDAEGAGPRVAVEHARARDARRENVEERLAKLIGGWSQPGPRRRNQATALV